MHYWWQSKAHDLSKIISSVLKLAATKIHSSGESNDEIFANVQGTRELVEIDPLTDAIVQRNRIPGAVGNHGLLIEPALRLAFIACEGNDILIVLDLRAKKFEAHIAVGQGPDVLAYEATLKRWYVASESGIASVFNVSAEATVVVDLVSHEVYFPLKETGHQPILRVMRPVSPN